MKTATPSFRITAQFGEGYSRFDLRAATPLAAITKAVKSLGFDYADANHSPLLLTIVPQGTCDALATPQHRSLMLSVVPLSG